MNIRDSHRHPNLNVCQILWHCPSFRVAMSGVKKQWESFSLSWQGFFTLQLNSIQTGPLHARPTSPIPNQDHTSALCPGECALIARSALTGVGTLVIYTLSTSTRVFFTFINICKAQYVLVRNRIPVTYNSRTILLVSSTYYNTSHLRNKQYNWRIFFLSTMIECHQTGWAVKVYYFLVSF